jgi:hypothetical protein
MRVFITWLYSGQFQWNTKFHGLCQLLILADYLDAPIFKDCIMMSFSSCFSRHNITASMVETIYNLPPSCSGLRRLCCDLITATGPKDIDGQWPAGPEFDFSENEIQAWDALRKYEGDVVRDQTRPGLLSAHNQWGKTSIACSYAADGKYVDDLQIIDVKEWLHTKLAVSKLVNANQQTRALSILDIRRRNTPGRAMQL